MKMIVYEEQESQHVVNNFLIHFTSLLQQLHYTVHKYALHHDDHSFCRSVRFLVGVNRTQNIYRQTQRTCSGKCTYLRTLYVIW